MSAEQSPKQAAKQASKQASGEGFIGRWSRLKRDTTAVEPLDVSATPRVPPSVAAAPGAEPTGSDPAAVSTGAATGAASGSPGQAAHDTDRPRQPGTILPSIESLGKDSDYSMFMKADVDPQLRLSALKKMFTDPHFNQMDGLDIYIDDYTKPDPIPLAMLKRLNQSRMLNLFQEEPAKDSVPPEPAGALADGAPEQGPRAALGSEDSQALRDVQAPQAVQTSQDVQEPQEPQEAVAVDRSAELPAPRVLPATPGLPMPRRETAGRVDASITGFGSPVSGKSA